jgi:hypothetical protein
LTCFSVAGVVSRRSSTAIAVFSANGRRSKDGDPNWLRVKVPHRRLELGDCTGAGWPGAQVPVAPVKITCGNKG